MDKLREQRPEFNAHYYSPEKVDGRPRSLVECPDHKLKNFGQGVMNQALSTEAGYDVAGRYWWPLERERCLATAKEKHIAAEAVLLRAVDKQSDLVWRAFVVDESFKQSLLDDGHASRSKRYDYQSLTNMALPHWNTGSLLDPTCADYKAWVQDFVSRAENKLEHRVATVREHHKIKP